MAKSKKKEDEKRKQDEVGRFAEDGVGYLKVLDDKGKLLIGKER